MKIMRMHTLWMVVTGLLQKSKSLEIPQLPEPGAWVGRLQDELIKTSRQPLKTRLGG